MCVYVYVCVYMCVYVYVCVYMCVYVYVCVCMCVYACVFCEWLAMRVQKEWYTVMDQEGYVFTVKV